MPAESISTADDRPIRRRVRTGCQRCRLRRRKCDERKPICSNCAERNFECHYGLQLRFPVGNARTAPQVETGASSSIQYTQIRFADDPEDDKNGRQHRSNAATQAPPVPRTRSASHASSSQHSHKASAEQVEIFGRRHEAAREKAPQQQQQHHVNTTVTPAHNFQFHYFASPQHKDARSAPARHLQAGSAEHGAIQSLVSLAMSAPQQHNFIFQDDENNVFQSNHSHAAAAPEQHRDATVPNAPAPRSNSVVTSAVTHDILGAPDSPASADSVISEERSIDLLRYYRYHVAPWLDMLDLHHHLGQHLPTVAASSPSILYALHTLSARYRELASGAAHSESSRYYRLSSQGVDMSEDALEARIIRLIADLISTPLSTWPRQLVEHGAPLLTPLYPYALEVGLVASLFWCVFRLDLAAALATETGMAATDLDVLLARKDEQLGGGDSLRVDENPGGGSADSLDTTCDVVDQSALRALLLCGQAVHIHQEHRLRDAGGNERARPQNHLVAWQSAWAELSAWYTRRHKFVKPLLEVSLPSSVGDDDDDERSSTPYAAFPTIIFTTAAATLANLVYHAAAIVLLECKPKTLKNNIPGHASPAVSLHWHAQRTCAIAVSNANSECWDPCAVACVLLAARRMTHREQQASVLEMLGRASAATGWKIEGEVRGLREFWALAEHS